MTSASLIRHSNSSRAAADIAGLQYKEGTADYLVLLDAEREHLNAEDAQALGIRNNTDPS